MIDNRKQQSPSSSACCSTGHNISFGDESSLGASLDILEDFEIDEDVLSQSIDSAIIDDENTIDDTENTFDETEYGQESPSYARSFGGSIDYDPEIEGQKFSEIMIIVNNLLSCKILLHY